MIIYKWKKKDLKNQKSLFEIPILDEFVELLEFIVAHLFLYRSMPKPSS
jgi:hypothetical protein